MKLRTLLLGTAVALSSTFAMAADLPARTAPAPLMAYVPYSWTGAYVGVHAGYGQLSAKRTDSAFGSGSSSGLSNSGSGGGGYAGSQHTNASGALGGVQLGYNRQYGSLVVGLEADISATSLKGSTLAAGSAASSGTGSGSGGGTSSLHASSRMSNFGTVRARFGFAADRALFYVTGGLAYAKVKSSVTYDIDTPYWGSAVTASQSGWKTGWTVGAGMEYALTNNWSVKTEALYFDLGKKNYEASFIDINGGVGSSGSVKNTGMLARVGVNYRFW